MRYVGALAVVGSLAAGVWVVSQPPPPATTGELQFPKLSAPYTCSAGREGRVYYDMDVDTPYWCDDTNWVSFTGLTIAGTFPFIPRFNSTGLNIEDSVLRATGLPAAGASGDLLDMTQTLNAMDGSDTVNGLLLDLTNGAHTGSNNLRGINIDSITDVSGLTGIGLLIGTGWDRALQAASGAFILSGQVPAAATSGDLLLLQGSLTVMNGSDNVRILNIAPNNANHTGTGNVLEGISIEGITADPDATEIAIRIGESAGANPWDRDMSFFTEGIIGTHTHFYNENATGHFVFDTDDSDPNYIFGAAGTAQVVFQGSKEITSLMGTDLDLSGTTLTIDPNANVVEISGDGADTVSIITAPTTASHTERVTLICSDADVTFNDADAAGAAGTLDLLGTAVGFVCSADDSLTLVYLAAPKAGNARWIEVSRSVN